MTDQPEFRKITEQTVVRRLYAVSGVAPSSYEYRRTTFRPDTLQITLTDGSVTRVDITGPRTKQDGSDGLLQSDYSFRTRKEWPDWVRRFVEGMKL